MNPHDKERLKECPFCGSDDIAPVSKGYGYCMFRCQFCRTKGPTRTIMTEAATAWNTRPQPPAGNGGLPKDPLWTDGDLERLTNFTHFALKNGHFQIGVDYLEAVQGLIMAYKKTRAPAQCSQVRTRDELAQIGYRAFHDKDYDPNDAEADCDVWHVICCSIDALIRAGVVRCE